MDYLDHTGSGQYLIGDERPLLARVTSDLGVFPPSGFYTVAPKTVAGEHYVWDVVLDGEVPELDISPDSVPEPPEEDYRVVVEFTVDDETVYGTNLDDSDVFSFVTEPGPIDFFICDEDEFSGHLSGQPFEAFEAIEGSKHRMCGSHPNKQNDICR